MYNEGSFFNRRSRKDEFKLNTLHMGWAQLRKNFRAFWMVLGIQLLLGIALLAVNELITNLFFRGHENGVFEFLISIANLVLAYLNVVSGLRILQLMAVEEKPLTFTAAWQEYFTYFGRSWKIGLGPYFVWQILIPICITIAGFIVAVAMIFFMAGTSVLWASTDRYAFYDAAEQLITSGGAFVILVIGLLIVSFVFSLLVSACSYYGTYKIAGRELGVQNYPASFTKCVLFALWPALGVGVLVAVMLLALIMMIPADYMAVMLGLLLIVGLAICLVAFVVVYQSAVMTGMLMEIARSGLSFETARAADVQPDIPLPVKPVVNEDENDLPPIPGQTSSDPE